MPINNARTCWECGSEFEDYSEYSDHLIECSADGCGELYCGTEYGSCQYCNGEGYYDDYDNYGRGVGIYSYDYRPSPIWFGGRGADYYLGFELEISADRYDTTPITTWCANNGHADMVYCKEDGSVEGFEIVSHPMTPEFFDTVNWESFFAMLDHHYPLGRGDEPSGHGLHVHVSRTAFPHKSTLARWSYLLNRNEDHVCRVARRSHSSWARFTQYPVRALLPYERNANNWWTENGALLPCGCCYETVRVTDNARRLRYQYQTVAYPERYCAVNLTNSETVEVRVFKSTRKPSEFISSLHFVIASVEFARSMQPWNATRDSVAWERFAEYVQSHPVFAKEAQILTGSPIAEPANV